MTKYLFYMFLIVTLTVSCKKPEPKITFEKLKQLKVDMTYKECIDHIGLPYEINIDATSHNGSCKHPFSYNIIPTKSTNIKGVIDSLFSYYPCCEASKEFHPFIIFYYYNKQESYLFFRQPRLVLDFTPDGKLSGFNLYLKESIFKENAYFFSDKGFGYSYDRKGALNEQEVNDVLGEL